MYVTKKTREGLFYVQQPPCVQTALGFKRYCDVYMGGCRHGGLGVHILVLQPALLSQL